MIGCGIAQGSGSTATVGRKCKTPNPEAKLSDELPTPTSKPDPPESQGGGGGRRFGGLLRSNLKRDAWGSGFIAILGQGLGGLRT